MAVFVAEHPLIRHKLKLMRKHDISTTKTVYHDDYGIRLFTLAYIAGIALNAAYTTRLEMSFTRKRSIL